MGDTFENDAGMIDPWDREVEAFSMRSVIVEESSFEGVPIGLAEYQALYANRARDVAGPTRAKMPADLADKASEEALPDIPDQASVPAVEMSTRTPFQWRSALKELGWQAVGNTISVTTWLGEKTISSVMDAPNLPKRTLKFLLQQGPFKSGKDQALALATDHFMAESAKVKDGITQDPEGTQEKILGYAVAAHHLALEVQAVGGSTSTDHRNQIRSMYTEGGKTEQEADQLMASVTAEDLALVILRLASEEARGHDLVPVS